MLIRMSMTYQLLYPAFDNALLTVIKSFVEYVYFEKLDFFLKIKLMSCICF
jgi:hypothetical protein